MRPVRELGRTQYIFLSAKQIATFGVDIVSSKVVSRKIDAISSETRMRASPDAKKFTLSKKDTKIPNVDCVEQLFFLLFYTIGWSSALNTMKSTVLLVTCFDPL